jgi:hypothetical protein
MKWKLDIIPDVMYDVKLLLRYQKGLKYRQYHVILYTTSYQIYV